MVEIEIQENEISEINKMDLKGERKIKYVKLQENQLKGYIK